MTEVDPNSLLHDGQELDQPTFHELYLRTPPSFRAELIDGAVYVMSSPISPKHSLNTVPMGWFLSTYRFQTPGTIVHGELTAKLSPRSEVQPDGALLIESDPGGQTGQDFLGYITGCPELVVEIAVSSRALDLGLKKRAYEEAGAQEYIVHDVEQQAIRWFALQEGRFEPLPIDPDGLFRSRVFPGLWLDASAFLRGDARAVLAGVGRGLASPEHAAFVARLEQSRRDRP